MIDTSDAVVLGPETAQIVEAAIASRRSVRAFRPDPVPREVVKQLLKVSARAPSGTNMQPWRVHVLAGAAKDALSDALEAVHLAGGEGHEGQYPNYPSPLFEPYLLRRRKIGWDLYGLLGIRRGETERMRRQHARNFRFFGAPVGMIFTIDARLELGSWLDYGMFLENIMIAARGHGLDTCPQAAFATYHRIVREHLGLGEQDVVVCGMALGYADESAPENRLRTERASLAEFASFSGF